MVRVAQIFRILRIIRLFRLMRFWQVLKAKAASQHVDLEVAEHMQKVKILSCFVRAHVSSQEKLVKYFGSQGEVDSVELSRCILQSQTFCYQAMLLEIKEKERLERLSPALLDELRVAREAKAITEDLEEFVCSAHSSGVLTSKEAENIIHTLHHSISGFCKRIVDCQQGRVVLAPDTDLKHKEDLQHDMEIRTSLRSLTSQRNTGIVNQILEFKPRVSYGEGQEIERSGSNAKLLKSVSMGEVKIISPRLEPTEEPAPEPNLEPMTNELIVSDVLVTDAVDKPLLAPENSDKTAVPKKKGFANRKRTKKKSGYQEQQDE